MRKSDFQTQSKHLLAFSARMNRFNPRHCQRFANMVLRIARLAVKQNGTPDLAKHQVAVRRLRNQGYCPKI